MTLTSSAVVVWWIAGKHEGKAREKDMKEAIKKLESKGYFVDNQFDGFTSTIENEYELYKGENVVIDHLSEAQVIALADLVR